MQESYGIAQTASQRVGRRELAYSRIMYFGYYLALGAFMPFLNLYYERAGLSGVQIGSITAIAIAVGALSGFILSGIADAYSVQNQILKIALFLCPLMVFILSKATTLQSILFIIIGYALFNGPVVSILDSSALETAKKYRSSFGSLRLWGTISWSISALLVGVLIENFDIRWIFYSYILFMAFTFLMSFMNSIHMPRLKASVRQELNQLLRPSFFLFLLSVLLAAIAFGGFLSFFSIYLDGINAGEGLIGFAWTLASLSEIPIFFVSGHLIKKINAGGLLKVSFIAFALRWLILSFISNPYLALMTQLLHGISFASFLVGGVTYISELVPEGLNTTAQSIFNGVAYGLAAIIGSLLGGYFFDTWGMPAMFRFFSLIAICGLFIFYMGDKLRARQFPAEDLI